MCLKRLQAVKANIHLSHRRDKRAYAQCYRDMVQANPCARTYVLLGEAYMRLQMPEVMMKQIVNALLTSLSPLFKQTFSIDR